MKKEYDTSVKEAIERVMSVFSEYIKTTPYFDIVWSGKVGYMDLLTKWRADPFCGKMVIGGMQHDGTPKQTNGNDFRGY